MAFKPIEAREVYINKIARDIISFEWQWYYKPILDILKPNTITNDNNALFNALKSGALYYQNGAFYSKSGRFSNTIAKELEKIGARYSKYGRCYRIAQNKIPDKLLWTIETTNARTYSDVLAIKKVMDNFIGNIEELVKNIKLTDLAEGLIQDIEKRAFENMKANKIEVITPKMTDFRAREFANNYTETLRFDIKDKLPEQIVKMREVVGQMAIDGESRITIQRYIENNFEKDQKRAKFLARNESKLAVTEYLKATYQENGAEMFRWITNYDERARDLHKELGKTKDNKYGINGTNIFRFDNPPIIDERTGTRGLPGEFYNCLVGDMNIVSPFPNFRIFKRKFTGELTTLVLPMGTLKVTANHPILSDRGWVAAKDIQIGDKIAKICNEAFFRGSTNPDYTKTRIDEFFGFYNMLFENKRITISDSDFHGDVSIDNKVDVINIESKLRKYIKPAFNEFDFKFFLAKANEAGFINSSDSTFFKAFPIGGLTTSSEISLISEVFAFFFGSKCHSIIHTFGAVSWLDTILDKSIGYNTTTNPEFFCKLFNTHSIVEQIYKLILWDIFNFVVNKFITERFSTLNKCFVFNAEQLSNVSKSHAFGIEFDTVQDKSISVSSIHIYNLENQNNWYYTENYITKNCRCTFIPVFQKINKQYNII